MYGYNWRNTSCITWFPPCPPQYRYLSIIVSPDQSGIRRLKYINKASLQTNYKATTWAQPGLIFKVMLAFILVEVVEPASHSHPLQNAQNEPNGIGSIVRLQTNSPRGPDLNCSVLIRDHDWWSRSIYIASIASHCVNEPRKILGNCKLNIVHFAFPQFHASVDCQMRSVNLQRKAVRSFMLQWGIGVLWYVSRNASNYMVLHIARYGITQNH